MSRRLIGIAGCVVLASIALAGPARGNTDDPEIAAGTLIQLESYRVRGQCITMLNPPELAKNAIMDLCRTGGDVGRDIQGFVIRRPTGAPDDPNYRWIYHPHSDRCLSIENSETDVENGDAIQLEPCEGWGSGSNGQGDDSVWGVYRTPGTPQLKIVSNTQGHCMEVDEDWLGNPTDRVQAWDCVGQTGAKWARVPFD